MTWTTVDAYDTRITHPTEEAATLHALRRSRQTGHEVAVLPPTRGHCARPISDQCTSAQPCACGAEVKAEIGSSR